MTLYDETIHDEMSAGHWITQAEWELNEAVAVINDEILFIVFSNGPLLDNINSRTYKMALKAIRRGELLIVRFCDGEGHGPNEYYTTPRDFVEWAQTQDIVIPDEVLEYFNYEYWAKQDGWTFDELVTLIVESKPPLPSEIVNTLEREDTYHTAKRVRSILFKSSKFSRYARIPVSELVQLLEEENIPLPGKLIAKINARKPMRSNKGSDNIQATIKAETACEEWLALLMNGAKQKAKKEYRDEALKKFKNLSHRAFDRAWDRAATKTNPSWKQSGRPKKISAH